MRWQAERGFEPPKLITTDSKKGRVDDSAFFLSKSQILKPYLSAGALVILLPVILVASGNLVLFCLLLLLHRLFRMGRMDRTGFLLLILAWRRHESLLVNVDG